MKLTVSRIEQIAWGVKLSNCAILLGARCPPSVPVRTSNYALPPACTPLFAHLGPSRFIPSHSRCPSSPRRARFVSPASTFQGRYTIEAEAPRTGFALAEARHSILIVRGIGVTPIMSHARYQCSPRIRTRYETMAARRLRAAPPVMFVILRPVAPANLVAGHPSLRIP